MKESARIVRKRRKDEGTHGKGLGALIVGQSWYSPDDGLDSQSLLPPPQFAIPLSPIKEAPIRRMTVPVTIGGNIRCSIRTGTKDMNISRKEQMRDVPMTFPYASGQGSRVMVPSAAVVLVQVPSLYSASKI